MKRSGFTLVEIAIVLVIIGLLLGGILKGQEMITQGKIKSAVSDFSGVSAAYYAYLDRYKALPGDDSQAVVRWPVASYPGMTVGNGNGVIVGAYNLTTPDSAGANESANFWNHLRAAGLVTGATASTITLPVNSAGGIIGVQTGDGAAAPGYVLSGGDSGFRGAMICSTNLPDKVAASVDRQMDDGVSNSGNIRAQLSSSTAIQTSAYSSYTETGGALYTLCKAF